MSVTRLKPQRSPVTDAGRDVMSATAQAVGAKAKRTIRLIYQTAAHVNKCPWNVSVQRFRFDFTQFKSHGSDVYGFVVGV